MATYSSKLDGLYLPIDLAKKGKGHRNVLGKFSISTTGYVEPELYIPYLNSFVNTVFLPENLNKVCSDIATNFSVSSVEIDVLFDLPMERMSEKDYVDSISTYTAGYQFEYTKKKLKKYIYVILPVVVQEIAPTLATMTLVLGYDIDPYFEDIIFTIEKNIVPLNPAYTPDEKQLLRTKLLNSKNIYGVMSNLLDIYSENPYIVSCDIEVKYRSCVLKTDISHVVEWKKK